MIKEKDCDQFRAVFRDCAREKNAESWNSDFMNSHEFLDSLGFSQIL
jgi:hypothetical protein